MRGNDGVVCKYYGDKYRYVFQWVKGKIQRRPCFRGIHEREEPKSMTNYITCSAG
jgi:hypothetical protein